MPLDKGTVERTWAQLSFSYKDKGIITTWNKKAEEVLARKSEDMVGKVWTELLVPEWISWSLSALEKVQFQGEEVALPMVTGDGLHCCVRFVVRKFGRGNCFLFSCGHTPCAETLRQWPLEIRQTEGQGRAAFAACDLPGNEMLLEEEPVYIRPPPSLLHGRPEWDQAWSAAFNQIRAALKPPAGASFASLPEKPLFASTALVRDVLGFATLPESLRSALLGFSFPHPEDPHPLVDVARQLAELCKERLPECKEMDVKLLQVGILVQEMNIFPGGRVFWTLSRINHSCAPNCVFFAAGNRWGLRSLHPISAGEEITISYLGEELLLPTAQRQWLLWRSKCFICGCPRCASEQDPMRDRVCACAGKGPSKWRVVHQPAVWRRQVASTQGRAVALLKEGTEFPATGQLECTAEGLWVYGDDETDPKKSGWALVDGSTLGLGRLIEPVDAPLPGIVDLVVPGRLQSRLRQKALNSRGKIREQMWYDREFEELPDLVAAAKSARGAERGAMPAGFARLDVSTETWSCGCGAKLGLHPKEKELTEVAQRVFAMALQDHPRASAAGVKGLILPEEAFVLAALRLADDAGQLLGRRHWIWQLGLLFALDLDLSLTRYTYMKWDLAFASGTVAMLLEVWDWLASLNLSQDPSHFLHSRASRLAKELERVPSDAGQALFRDLQQQLQDRLSFTPAVSLLPSRDFIPDTLFIAH
ncbi:unnamed protein product [Effrenium voratum]|nr:unnamed protein product [Effrenium voratum]